MIRVHLFKGIGAEYAELCFDRMASMETTAMEDYKADAREILQLFNACLPMGTLTELKKLLSDSEMDEREDGVEPLRHVFNEHLPIPQETVELVNAAMLDGLPL